MKFTSGFPSGALTLAASIILSPGVLRLDSTETTIISDGSLVNEQSFDYVIAGGGPAGLVVANKLAERGNTVLVIEAGPDLKDDPKLVNAATRTEHCNWLYTASEEDGTPISKLVSSGRCVGGSTSMNGLIWFRPAAAELDAVESLGNNGWGSSSLFPYMTAVEKVTAPNAQQIADGADLSSSSHGNNGQVQTSFPTPMRIPTAVKLYKEAFLQVLGIVSSSDLSFRSHGGLVASTMWTIIYDAVSNINRRSSAAFAFLYPPSQQRPTETVLTNHLVESVIFDSNNRATGLNFVSFEASEGKRYTVTANKEVILTAGALASSPILERSGIGAKAVLDRAGVAQRVELPGVGRNLQDQPGTSLSGQVNQANASDPLLQDGRNIFAPVIALPDAVQLFGQNEADMLLEQLTLDIPALAQAAVSAGAAATVKGAEQIYTTIRDMLVNRVPIGEILGESYPGFMTGIFWPTVPLSRGHIHIKSGSVYDAPTITPRLYSSAFDMKISLALSKKVRALWTSNAFQHTVVDPTASGPPLGASDTEWEEWIKRNSYGASHWLGSTSLQPREVGGVVSPKLNVYGTTCLRVIDGGIFPVSFTGHTMPIVYAAALKGADMILQDGC